MSDKSMKFRINGENLRREIEAVRTLNIVHEPLRELLDQILADHSVSPRSISARSVPPRTPDEVAAEVAAIERANADRLERRYAAFNQPVPLDRGPKPEMSGPKLQDRQIAAQGRWAIATDGAQWILQRRRGDAGKISALSERPGTFSRGACGKKARNRTKWACSPGCRTAFTMALRSI